ncbi:alpha/beta hydrolase [Paraburkholderia tropica]|uniref:Acetyl esterase/lipase n=1 Tax=Paraburkholderia tropica TaxID=92647 RepID=A0AAQ1GB97_9BURK|nr:alpha/beta hydrolase [Paraburkholderia tropica]MBB2978424.1 acetyl esterase/lipase [Paraburkholderia tropica]MDE1139518.1 alpha/beta hydrolase [Paraburkholderia tropica]PXX19971.1 acetyl esterase/lipase [Paraburkholderia tropica]PZW88912.1 acetyl esterase/lipase [Paraburkholderia tropica]QNB13856.1 alpha/beta hydrolase [Paraburkholderia tropica]
MDAFKRSTPWISAAAQVANAANASADAPYAPDAANEPAQPARVAPASPVAGKARGRTTAIDVSEVTIEGHVKDIVLRLYRPQGANNLPVLLYFHGGGFVRGTLDDADVQSRFFAERLPALVVSVDYSLAPEFPFPAAPEDAHRAALWVLTRARAFGGSTKRVIAAGHDAGGQIANVLAFIGRDRGDVKLAAQALFAPMLDPSLTRLGDERRLGSDITASECAQCYRAYLPDATQRMHPYAAPLESSRLGGLPPTLIVTAQNDVLHIEAEKYASRLIDSGVRTHVVRYPSVSHAQIGAHEEALAEAVRFFKCCFEADANRDASRDASRDSPRSPRNP